jgi:hypothetical protein
MYLQLSAFLAIIPGSANCLHYDESQPHARVYKVLRHDGYQCFVLLIVSCLIFV